MRPFWGMLLVFGGAALPVACGNGTGVESTFSSPSGGVLSGAGGAGAAPASDASSSASSSSSEASSSASGGGASSSSASSSSSSGAGGGGGCDHSAPDTCDTAQELTTIDGDQNNDTRTVTGTTSAWFKVFVNDAVTFNNKYESYTATLVSPPGVVFRLFAYTGDGMMTNCLGAAVQGTGMPPSVSDQWDDDLGSNSRWISLEVRYESGQVCNPMPKWTLTVQGNTNP